jgi:hypothetical protein
MMKVFVYSKKTSKLMFVVKDVVKVEEHPDKKKIYFQTVTGETVSGNTCEVKSTIYQN